MLKEPYNSKESYNQQTEVFRKSSVTSLSQIMYVCCVCVCVCVRENSCCREQATPNVWRKYKLQGSAERQGRRQRKTRPRTKWPEEVNEDSRFTAIRHGGVMGGETLEEL